MIWLFLVEELLGERSRKMLEDIYALESGIFQRI